MDDPDISAKFAPFVRKDIRTISIVWCFPWYMTYFIRVMIGWVTISFLGIATAIISWGQDCTNLDPWRKSLISFFSRYCCRIIVYVIGYCWIEYDYDKSIDYKEYLGSDWKPKYEGANIHVSNHVGFIDVMVATYYLYPSFIARSTVKKNYFLRKIGEAARCIYV